MSEFWELFRGYKNARALRGWWWLLFLLLQLAGCSLLLLVVVCQVVLCKERKEEIIEYPDNKGQTFPKESDNPDQQEVV